MKSLKDIVVDNLLSINKLLGLRVDALTQERDNALAVYQLTKKENLQLIDDNTKLKVERDFFMIAKNNLIDDNTKLIHAIDDLRGQYAAVVADNETLMRRLAASPVTEASLESRVKILEAQVER